MKKTIRSQASPHHVPSEVYTISEISVTRNGKKEGLTVRNIFEETRITNRNSLANPSSLREFENIKMYREAQESQKLV